MTIALNPIYHQNLNFNEDALHYSRRLKAQPIHATLTRIRTSLLQRVTVTESFCGTSRMLAHFTSQDYQDIPKIKRVYIELVLPFVCVASATTIVVTLLIAKKEADGYLGPEVIAVATCGLLAISILPIAQFFMSIGGGILQWIPTRNIYSKYAAEIIDRRVHIIDTYLQSIQGAEYAQPEKLAELISTIKLESFDEASLIGDASIAEFALMLQEFSRRKFTDIRLMDHYHFARILLEDPPVQDARYHEYLIRASPMLQTPDDYLFLQNRLMPDDSRRAFLRFGAIVEEDTSSYSSESTDSVSIEIAGAKPEVCAIYIEDVRILVDAEALHKESHWQWFNQLPVVIQSTYPYLKELFQILSNLKDIPSLWTPLIPANKDQYLQLFKAFRFYQFSKQQHQLCMELFNAAFMEMGEKLEIVRWTIDVADDETRSIWYEHIYTLVRNEDALTYAAALAFAVKHFSKEIALRYTEHLCSTATTFSGMKIKEVARFRDHFPRAMEVLKRNLREYLRPNTAPLDIFYDDPEILEWMGTEMLLPDSKLITIVNFRNLWPLVEKNATIARAMHRFASAHRSAVVGLWATHEVPNELVESLLI